MICASINLSNSLLLKVIEVCICTLNLLREQKRRRKKLYNLKSAQGSLRRLDLFFLRLAVALRLIRQFKLARENNERGSTSLMSGTRAKSIQRNKTVENHKKYHFPIRKFLFQFNPRVYVFKLPYIIRRLAAWWEKFTLIKIHEVRWHFFFFRSFIVIVYSYSRISSFPR